MASTTPLDGGAKAGAGAGAGGDVDNDGHSVVTSLRYLATEGVGSASTRSSLRLVSPLTTSPCDRLAFQDVLRRGFSFNVNAAPIIGAVSGSGSSGVCHRSTPKCQQRLLDYCTVTWPVMPMPAWMRQM